MTRAQQNIQHASATPHKINFKIFPNANHFTNSTNKAKTKSITIKNFRQHKSPPTINNTTAVHHTNHIIQSHKYNHSSPFSFYSFPFFFISARPTPPLHNTQLYIIYIMRLFIISIKGNTLPSDRNKQKIKQRTKFLHRQTHK